MLLGLYYFITFLYCPNPASGLQYRNKRIDLTFLAAEPQLVH